MIRAIPWTLFAASILAALFLFVLLLNAGVALDDSKLEVLRLRERSELVLRITRKDWIGKEATSVADLAHEIGRQGVITKRTKDGSFEIGDLIFEIKDGVVTQVRYFD
ncbi:hypothetical protein [Dokdonella sp.]|uniref:hypothetical protein n=1 Tax=Dokdonella sp. TaxID=2291710 RepID=UPI002CBDDB0C|nr:hypothetical protein [Dokdonella sp.]HPN80205.1 hypothetical protein [Dokdonella sp.]